MPGYVNFHQIIYNVLKKKKTKRNDLQRETEIRNPIAWYWWILR